MTPTPARDSLEREVYWLTLEGPGEAEGETERIRAALEHLERMLKGDATQKAPWSDRALRRGSRWKRKVKEWLFRSTRPISRRYDWITADLAALGVNLSERLLEAEREIKRLRDEISVLEREVRTSPPERRAG